MFRGDWNRDTSIVGLAIVVVLNFVLWAGISIGNYQHDHRKEREAATAHNTNAVGQQRRIQNGGISTSGTPLNTTNAPHSDTGSKYTEYDLKAQQDMAEWAYAMFLATSAGIFITAIGIFYVRKTLQLTREIAIAERRPWISEADIEIGEHRSLPNNREWIVKLYIGIENKGSQPALHVAVGKLVGLRDGDTSALISEIQAATNQGGRILFPNAGDEITASLRFTPDLSYPNVSFNGWFGGWIQYGFAGSDEIHITPFVYEIGVDTDNPVEQHTLKRVPHHIPAT